MDISHQTICVLRPAYFTIAFLLLLAATIASGISIVIATLRRIRGPRLVPPAMRWVHAAVFIAWVLYATVIVIGTIREMRMVREYERATARPAPGLRAAMKQETRTIAAFGAGCAAIGLLSMLAGRGVGRRAGHEELR